VEKNGQVGGRKKVRVTAVQNSIC